MSKSLKTWINTPTLGLVLCALALVANPAQAAEPCDIELSQPSYTSGETVRLSVFRLTNSAAESQLYEWKLWLRAPGLPDFSLVNQGFDSSLVLPAGFDVDFGSLIGPIDIFTVDNVLFFPGAYEIGCRLLNPVTGEEYPDADVIAFDVL